MKNKVQVTIEGKTFTIKGEESEEYIKQIVKYINEKFFEIKNKEEAKIASTDMIYILTALNVADNYFKEVEKNITLSQRVEELELGYSGFSYEKSKELENQYYELEQENIRLSEELEKIKIEKQQLENDLNELLEKPKNEKKDNKI